MTSRAIPRPRAGPRAPVACRGSLKTTASLLVLGAEVGTAKGECGRSRAMSRFCRTGTIADMSEPQRRIPPPRTRARGTAIQTQTPRRADRSLLLNAPQTRRRKAQCKEYTLMQPDNAKDRLVARRAEMRKLLGKAPVLSTEQPRCSKVFLITSSNASIPAICWN